MNSDSLTWQTSSALCLSIITNKTRQWNFFASSYIQFSIKENNTTDHLYMRSIVLPLKLYLITVQRSYDNDLPDKIQKSIRRKNVLIKATRGSFVVFLQVLCNIVHMSIIKQHLQIYIYIYIYLTSTSEKTCGVYNTCMYLSIDSIVRRKEKGGGKEMIFVFDR